MHAIGLEPRFDGAPLDPAASHRDRSPLEAVRTLSYEEDPAASLADDVRAVAGSEGYEVGTGSVALVVPGAGRADALGLLARIQAACGATGSAVELEPDEDAVELVARLLAKRAPTVSG